MPAGERRARYCYDQGSAPGTGRLRPRLEGFSSATSGRKPRRKSSISVMPACCWDTANRRSQSGFTGELAPPRNPPNRQSFGTPTRKFWNSCQKQQKVSKTPETQKPRIAGLSFESWRETRDSNPGDAINVRRFSRPVHSTTLPISLVHHRIIVAYPVSAGAIIPE